VISIVAGLIASLSYGVSDFLGAFAAIRLRVIPTTTISYGAAVAVLAVVVVVTGDAWSAEVLFWGTVAGVCAVVGFVTFYAAMSRGPMSLVSPLIAVLSAAVPIAAALLLGETLPPAVWAGVVLALAAAVLIASPPRTATGRLAPRTGALSILSGVALGVSLIALDRAPADSGLIAALVEMAVGLAVLLAVLGLRAMSGSVKRAVDALGAEGGSEAALSRPRATVAAVCAGILLGVSGALVMIALQSGNLAVVSVLIALYPLSTIVLARIVLRERVSRLQLAGVSLALVASVVLGLAVGGA
jgi:drug/metabolite transporter (DMT)-like permease